jgi:hypothetical protein
MLTGSSYVRIVSPEPQGMDTVQHSHSVNDTDFVPKFQAEFLKLESPTSGLVEMLSHIA